MSEEKETIINGIDVSDWELKGVLIPITECKYFEGIGDCKESKGLCVDNNNCYFKQLKCLQEENEQLKKPCLIMPKVNQLAVPIDKYEKLYKALEEIREILMCKIYGLNENASQLDYMCYALDKFEKIRIKILTKINEVLNDRN